MFFTAMLNVFFFFFFFFFNKKIFFFFNFKKKSLNFFIHRHGASAATGVNMGDVFTHHYKQDK